MNICTYSKIFNQIVEDLEVCYSSKSNDLIQIAQTRLKGVVGNPIELANTIINYLKSPNLSQVKSETELSIVLYLDNSLKDAIKANFLNKDQMLILIDLYFTAITSGNLNNQAIDHLSQIFQYLLDHCSDPAKVIREIKSFFFTHSENKTFSISFTTGSIKILEIIFVFLIKKQDTLELEWIFQLIEGFLNEGVTIYEKIAVSYTNDQQAMLLDCSGVIKQLYLFFNSLFKYYQSNMPLIRKIIKFKSIVDNAIKILSVKYPFIDQYFLIIWTNNLQFNLRINSMIIAIFKTLIKIKKDKDIIFPMNHWDLVERPFIEHIVFFFETLISKYSQRIYKAIDDTIHSHSICIILSYCFTVMKKSNVNNFMKNYYKPFIAGVLFPLLSINKVDIELIKNDAQEYVNIIDDAANECHYKLFKTKAALILREISKSEPIDSFLCNYVFLYLSQAIEGMYDFKPNYNNPREDSDMNIIIEESIAIDKRLGLGLFVYYLLEKNEKVLKCIKTLLQKYGSILFSKERPIKFIPRIHFTLLMKKYFIDLYSFNDPISQELKMHLYLNLTDTTTHHIIANITGKALKQLLKIKPRNYDDKKELCPIFQVDLFSHKSINMFIKQLNSIAFFILLKNIIKNMKKDDCFIDFFSSICTRIKSDYNQYIVYKVKGKENQHLNTLLKYSFICLKGIVSNKDFISTYISSNNDQLEKSLCTLIEKNLLLDYPLEIIDLVAQIITLRKTIPQILFEALNRIQLYFMNQQVTICREYKEGLSIPLFMVINIRIVFGNESFYNCSNEKLFEFLFDNIAKVTDNYFASFLSSVLFIILFRTHREIQSGDVNLIIRKTLELLNNLLIEQQRIILMNQNNEHGIKFKSLQMLSICLIIVIYSGFLYYPQQTASIINANSSVVNLIALTKDIHISPKLTILNKMLIEGIMALLINDEYTSYNNEFIDIMSQVIINQINHRESQCAIKGKEEEEYDRFSIYEKENSIEGNMMMICNHIIKDQTMEDVSFYAINNDNIHEKSKNNLKIWIEMICKEKKSQLKCLLQIQSMKDDNSSIMKGRKRIKVEHS